MIRKAAFAGSFYPSDAEELRVALRGLLPHNSKKSPAKAIIAPHASYYYSGKVAGITYSSVVLPRRYILLCPNHTGVGAPLSIQSRGRWETPLGAVEIDRELADLVRKHCLAVQESPQAHSKEHAIEVHLPFLQQQLQGGFKFVPISVGTVRLESLLELGEGLAAALQECAEPVLMVASSDMNHFEDAELTRHKDAQAIDCICRLDSRRLFETVHERKVSMCGYGPAIAVIEASRAQGATRARLVRYSHSGEVNGQLSRVVGYAGVVIR